MQNVSRYYAFKSTNYFGERRRSRKNIVKGYIIRGRLLKIVKSRKNDRSLKVTCGRLQAGKDDGTEVTVLQNIRIETFYKMTLKRSKPG